MAPAVTITDPGRQFSLEGEDVNLQIQAADATGTPMFTAANLPAGLSISSSGQITGAISAGVAAKGPYPVTVTATDGAYSASQTLTWDVAATPADSSGGTISSATAAAENALADLFSGSMSALDAAFASLPDTGENVLIGLLGVSVTLPAAPSAPPSHAWPGCAV